MLTTRELDWAAGFIEGEGCFYLSGHGKKCPYISAKQVQKFPLERLEKMFGGTICRILRRHKNPNWNDIWEWRIGGFRAAGIMMTLYDLMSPRRREKIESVLSVWKLGVNNGEKANNRSA